MAEANICPTTGTYSHEHLLKCLAVNLLKRPLIERRNFIYFFEQKNGKAVAGKVKDYMIELHKVK